MDERTLFQAALHLGDPWEVSQVEFRETPDAGELHLSLDFARGSRFACAGCSLPAPVYDCTPDRVWRHLNFWQYPTYLHARLPRTHCPDCGVRTVEVAWARPESGFTLLFEALVLLFARQMPMAAVARLVGETDTRLWRLVLRQVETAHATVDLSEVREVGLDETTGRSGRSPLQGPWGTAGRHYLALAADLERRRVLWVGEGRSQQPVREFRDFLEAHGGRAEQVRAICLDYGYGYQVGAATAFPHSTVVFDHFHVIQVLHTALEKVRRAETKRQPALKRTRALWLQNPERLTPAQQTKLARLREIAVETARAYDWMQAVAQIWEAADREAGERCLEECLGVVDASYPRVLRTAAQTLRRHRDGILAYFEHRITNGLLEGLASLIQATKARARGFRTQRFFAGVIYLMHGNLPLPQAR